MVEEAGGVGRRPVAAPGNALVGAYENKPGATADPQCGVRQVHDLEGHATVGGCGSETLSAGQTDILGLDGADVATRPIEHEQRHAIAQDIIQRSSIR